MLFPLKAICNGKKAHKDGTSTIYIQYCYSATNRTLLNTEIKIPFQFWNSRLLCIENELPTEYGCAKLLNGSLIKFHRIIEDLIIRAKENQIKDTGAFVKTHFKPTLTDVSKLPIEEVKENTVEKILDVFLEIDSYILSKKKKVTPKAQTGFTSMKMHLLAFQEHRKEAISFNSFNYDFYDKFVEFLTYEYKIPRKKVAEYGLKINTIGRTIKQFRIFIADRIRRKIISPIDISDFKIPGEDSDAIYLTTQEIARLYHFDLSAHPKLAPYRDLFVLSSLSGLRFSDVSTLSITDLRNGMLYKKQSKTDDWTVIPMKKEACQIFIRLFLSGEHSFDNAVYNRYLKEIGRLAGLNDLITFSYKKGNKKIVETKPKYEWLTSHTARRSFCTNEFLLGTPTRLTMQISGHKTEKAFYRYIRISPEEGARKIQELWIERNGMVAFS